MILFEHNSELEMNQEVKLELNGTAFQTGLIGLRGFGGETIIFEIVSVKQL